RSVRLLRSSLLFVRRPPTPPLHTLSLHDALPISPAALPRRGARVYDRQPVRHCSVAIAFPHLVKDVDPTPCTPSCSRSSTSPSSASDCPIPWSVRAGP